MEGCLSVNFQKIGDIKVDVQKIDECCLNITVGLVCTTTEDTGMPMLWCPHYKVLWDDETIILWKKE